MPPFTRVTLTNRHSMQVELASFGARIVSIRMPNKSGAVKELTFSDHANQDILNDAAFKGATCGRIANRIGNAQFALEGVQYKLTANEGENILHSGKHGFSQRNWRLSAKRKSFHSDTAIFSLDSSHLEQGFPGNVQASVIYRLDNNNALNIEFIANSDRLTPINMCNHTYFTMSESDISELDLHVNASTFMQINPDGIPTGIVGKSSELIDFQKPQRLGDVLSLHEIDHCYILNKSQQSLLSNKPNTAPIELAAQLSSRRHKLRLDIFTNQPAMQVYTGKHLSPRNRAVALEAQGYIDAVNQRNFSADFASEKAPYRRKLVYRFTAL
ncbi:aldose epimerase family protein [Glaciecola siphonariae]|uniref:Aldose epimerase family protein n=1 Tax=Glaciecola siphonariae TaxID=521012 RepID=A0ABV9M0K2_9ALTE